MTAEKIAVRNFNGNDGSGISEEQDVLRLRRKDLFHCGIRIKCISVQEADLIFEDKEGEIDLTTEEDLPFDINQDIIDLEGMNYGIWYLDAMEHMDRYEGKTIRFRAMVA